MTIAISRKALADSATAVLEAPALQATVYVGAAPSTVPLQQGGNDPAGRVAPYVVLHSGVGSPGLETDLAGDGDDLVWSFTVRCVAGWEADCLALADRVFARFFRWRPEATGALAGLGFGRAAPPAGFDPGEPLYDPRATPPRYFVPLQFQLPVTR